MTLHLRYQAQVTDKRISIGLVIPWLATGLASFALVALPSRKLLAIVVQSLGFVVITAAYFRIYQVVRRHRNQIHSQRQVQNGQTIDPIHKWRPIYYSFIFMLISPTSLILEQKFF